MPTEYNAGESQEVVVKVVVDDAAQMAHYVHWRGEGWYRGELLGVAHKYVRWTYATPEEMREYPCQYLHQAGSVVLPSPNAYNTALVVDADLLGAQVNQLRDAQAANDLRMVATEGGAMGDDQAWVSDRAGNIGVVMDRDDWMELHCVLGKLDTNSPLTIEEQSHIANLHGDLLRDLRRGIEKAVNVVRVESGASKIDFDDMPEWEFPYGGWDN